MTGWDPKRCLESRGWGEHHISSLTPGYLTQHILGGQVLHSPKLCERAE